MAGALVRGVRSCLRAPSVTPSAWLPRAAALGATRLVVSPAALRGRCSLGAGWEGTRQSSWWGWCPSAATAAALLSGGLVLASHGTKTVVDCEAAPDEVVDASALQQFDRNWDGRAPKEGEEEPSAYRYIILVRHGQYNTKAKNDSDATLTGAGRQQAQVLAQKIVDTYGKPNRVIRSEMMRAIETFDIVMKKLPRDTPTAVIADLKEGRPCQPTPPSASGLYKKSVVEADGKRIDEAFDRIFYRAPVTQKEDSYDVVICHANVIRYFVCKALQVPTEVSSLPLVAPMSGQA